ncbi:MAG TPA: hypothetical protein VFZ89_01545, partial [Solirubrobacteraceae bacterium]
GPPPSVFGCCVVSFDGGAGADRLVSATALKTTLSFVGGPGPDSVTPGPADFVIWDYSTEGRTSGVHVTQDGVADDGAPGERDNVPPALGSVVGTDAADDISESPAGGSITALGGNDTLHAWYPVFTWFGGNDGDDRIFVRDGARDSVFCAAGHDTVQADPVDQLDSGCESVNVH